VECGRLLLEYGTDISTLDNEGKCCLHLAVEKRQENMVALLLQNKARSKLINHCEPGKERTPLHYAAIAANTKVKYLRH
jgi:ankyrin repeat protein